MQIPNPDLFDVTLPANPYPGLRPFEKDEWAIFFGREKMTDEIVERLIESQLLVVHGDSGCGKSSLMRAGVLARLEQQSMRGGLTWRTCTTQPRGAPLRLLAESLAALDGRRGDERRIFEIRRVLNHGRDAAEGLAELLRRGPADYICLLVDQFEELFAFAKRQGPEEAALYVDFLTGLQARPQPGLYAAVTMRSEFLGSCAQFRGFAEAVNQVQYLVPRMTHEDLLRAVREPAALCGGFVSAELAGRLISDAGFRQDELPLIQHGLAALFRRKVPDGEQEGWQLDISDYSAADGLDMLLSNHADELCREAGEARKPVIEALFRALTDINADGQAIRRPQTLGSLAKAAGTGVSELEALMRIFRKEGASFLSPYGSDPIGPDTLIDISHEALIRCWKRISDPGEGWLISEFEDGLIWKSLLVQAESYGRDAHNVLSPATAWEREAWLRKRNPSWAERYGGGWQRVAEMVEASVEAARQAEEENERRIHELSVLTRKQHTLILRARNARDKAREATRRADEQAELAERRLQEMKQILRNFDDAKIRDKYARLYLPGEVKSLSKAGKTRLVKRIKQRRQTTKAQARVPAQDGLHLWANGSTLRVRFLGGSAVQRASVKRFAPQWSQFANLTFEFCEDRDAEVRISFQQDEGSWSYVGTDALGAPTTEPTMNLGTTEEGVVLHEFGHVLGLIHEHISPNAKLPWDRTNAYAIFKGPPNYWPAEVVRLNLFARLKGIKYRPFDLNSIMLYRFEGALFTDRRARGGRQALSKSDKAFASKLYPREAQASETSSPAAPPSAARRRNARSRSQG